MRFPKHGLRLSLGAMGLVAAIVTPAGARATVILNNGGLAEGSRWDAALRIIPGVGERSLDGGLRYSVQGGSYESYRDAFTWGVLPSVDEFQFAVERAFAAWTVVDPVSGLGTNLSFTPDLGTAVQGVTGGGINIRGAEIDLMATTDGRFWNPGDNFYGGETFWSGLPTGVTLTSGTTDYPGFSIWGADITLNSNANYIWTLDLFQLVLGHEIGHAIGLADVENAATSVSFLDDNYDGSSSASALATLTNSWALLVDPFDPSASPLSFFTVANGDPGIDTPGVDIFMESFIPEILLGDDAPLRNDDYGGRQFLYPFVPEPSTLLLLAAGLAGLAWRNDAKRA